MYIYTVLGNPLLGSLDFNCVSWAALKSAPYEFAIGMHWREAIVFKQRGSISCDQIQSGSLEPHHVNQGHVAFRGCRKRLQKIVAVNPPFQTIY
jgi:hypothetical protein